MEASMVYEETTTGAILTTPIQGGYTTPLVSTPAVYSSESDLAAVKTEMNMFDAIIAVAILAIVVLIIAMVATSKKEVKKKK